MATFCGISHIVHSSADCERCCVSLDSFHWFNVHMTCQFLCSWHSDLNLTLSDGAKTGERDKKG